MPSYITGTASEVAPIQVLTTPSAVNPVTGTFGSGSVEFIYQSKNFIVPEGVTNLRVRVWGPGGTTNTQTSGGGGGGFALRVIKNVTPGQTIVATVGIANAQTTSFGSFVSATGGSSNSPGTGIGGDLNYTGGTGGGNTGSGSAANVFGNGSDGGTPRGRSGTSGSGSYQSNFGGNGFSGSGAISNTNPATLFGLISLDYVGTGPGGNTNFDGINGGGAGSDSTVTSSGGTPGGGSYLNSTGGRGLIVVEW